ncbi:DNA adenine methylase [Candidatus Adlerbacteria bacterium RIFCSPHIGHO2_12_FULL_53_18]|uniref:Site-specific DNA-methyltransferase (adenine-specific) n=1 Tax=Candidatus Adlerbacteria bacterium RIFCSPHIGHO2_12_FULL_53_18 TaxID=1797242 RepID=A0A1F4XTG5_9BACT|nr:MAG: DNA adenine methylase [Candidatus Adlerbacteria bacterium RIFCSPHIGHO2_12_FULL_53_18]
MLPKEISKVIVPPIKCQGIKTKLVPFIAKSVLWDGNGTWVEPFLGSGVVAFNIQPKKAILADKNEHIINFYKKIQTGEINSSMVREFLKENGEKLYKEGGDFYYKVREDFNQRQDSLSFLFLNRSCFNGVIRFNKKGKFNVPFCKKPDRFRSAYITKITNQVKVLENIIKDKDWKFVTADWRETIGSARKGDLIYVDPPYIGRHTGYIDVWAQQEAEDLTSALKRSSAGFALSMWIENKYRKNQYVIDYWDDYERKTLNHFYHVGSQESLRNSMEEGLIMKSGCFA